MIKIVDKLHSVLEVLWASLMAQCVKNPPVMQETQEMHFLFFIYLFLKFYFIFKLYNIVLVLPNIEMNPPQVYMCSPS